MTNESVRACTGRCLAAVHNVHNGCRSSIIQPHGTLYVPGVAFRPSLINRWTLPPTTMWVSLQRYTSSSRTQGQPHPTLHHPTETPAPVVALLGEARSPAFPTARHDILQEDRELLQHPVGQISATPGQAPVQQGPGAACCSADSTQPCSSCNARNGGPRAESQPGIARNAASPEVRPAAGVITGMPDFTCPHAAAQATAGWSANPPVATSDGAIKAPAAGVPIRASSSYPNLRAVLGRREDRPARVPESAALPVIRTSSSCLPSAYSTSQDSGGPAGVSRRKNVQLSERATLLAAFYAQHQPVVGIVGDSTSDGSSRQRSVSRRRSGRSDDHRGGSAARSCPVPSVFAAAAAEEPASPTDSHCNPGSQSRSPLDGVGSDW